jgi:hypothetical protein
MNLPCSLCPRGTPKTDKLKLKTIKGRDYLLCPKCYKWSNHYEQQPKSESHFSGVQTQNGK